MELVIDANILMSALIASNGFTYDFIFNDRIKLFSPDYLLQEFEKHKKEILEKSNLTKEELQLFLSLISSRINFIEKSEFEKFLKQASEITPDINDTVYFALALKLNCPIWSNDKKLKQQNKIKIYSTEELTKVI
jgi:predicted nucleic acid-binding protein